LKEAIGLLATVPGTSPGQLLIDTAIEN